MGDEQLLRVFRYMYRSRIFEEHVIQFWNKGYITGEMHTSIGEEGINAGIIAHLQEGDALALDHRGTSPSIMNGLEPTALMLEFLGHEQGICAGHGGHMHIFSKDHLVASSGIVGASGPSAAGFALSAKYKRPGNIAVSFFGEGAMNQGMLMESLNLAVVLSLPVLFVCKNNDMSITTVSSKVTAGNLVHRAKAFDLPAIEIDGSDVTTVFGQSDELISSIRKGKGPAFIYAHCKRPDGHFLGDPLKRIVNEPLKELSQITSPLVKSTFKRKGSSFQKRANSLKDVASLLGKNVKDKLSPRKDPIAKLRKNSKHLKREFESIEQEIIQEMNAVVEEVSNIYKFKDPI